MKTIALICMGVGTVLVIAMTVGTLLFVGKSDSLVDLQHDSIAKYVPEGTTLVNNVVTDESRTLSDARAARIQRDFVVSPNLAVPTVIRQTLQAATSRGWETEKVSGSLAKLRKHLPSGDAEMTISLPGNRAVTLQARPLSLRIILEHKTSR